MAAPSVGRGIALQGRDNNIEKMANLLFKEGEAQANRNLKLGAQKVKQDADADEKAQKKFELPAGSFNRLILPKVNETQTRYTDQLKKLKAERPNDWQNGVNDLAQKYEQEMSVYVTRSKDLNKYEDITAVEDKANTFNTKNQKKFNAAYEKATDYDDLLKRLEESGFQEDAQIQMRPMGSVSYTPFRNMKPKETLEKNITQAITQLPFKSKESKKAYGYIANKEVKVRPVTYKPDIYGVSAEEIARYNNLDPEQVPSIEAVVDNFMMAPDGGMESIVQYADENNLNARFDQQGQLNPEDALAIKGHIMNWAKNFASPGITTSMMRPQQILQAQNEQTSSATADMSLGELGSKTGGVKSYKMGIVNYSFDKEAQSIDARPSDTFSGEFSPVETTTLPNVQADGVVILATDANGKPVKLSKADKDNTTAVTGADVFVRLKSGSNYYYKRYDNYSNISGQFLKKANNQLEIEVTKLLTTAGKYDVLIPKRKKEKANATFADLMATP